MIIHDQVNREVWHSPTDINSNHSKFYHLKIKRMSDILIGLLATVLLFPVMLVIALGIKWSTPGPVLFAQKRVGYKGKMFTFLKFRTMLANSDDSIHREYVTKLIKGEIQNGSASVDDKPLYKLDDDRRVTKIGKFLRAWSLDELPQLFNVLKGEMSLIGPRPAIPYEVENYRAWHMERLDVRPGITGLWQVRGRSRTTFDEMVRMDIEYIRNWSLLLDFKILLQTFKAVLSQEGAL